MDTLSIQYALTSDDVSIAYSVLGKGPALLISIPSMGSHLQKDWAFPFLQRYYTLLAQSLTLVRFDHRGGGLSAHSAGRYTTLDFAKDIAAVATTGRLKIREKIPRALQDTSDIDAIII